MTLNGVLALILRYFTEFNSFGALEAKYITVVEDRLIMSAEYRLPLLAKTRVPTLPCGISAIAELLPSAAPYKSEPLLKFYVMYYLIQAARSTEATDT